jgi:simple sugar transport system permease protein
MATLSNTSLIIQRRMAAKSQTRRYVMGGFFILVGILIYLFFASNLTSDVTTKFVMTPGGITRGVMGDWILPAHITLLVMLGLSILAGIYQLLRGFEKLTNIVLGLVVAFFIFSFLVWSAAGKSLNLAGMLSSAVLLSVPIVLAAFSGVITERAGVTNIAIEGMMLMGAMMGALIGSVTHSALIGLVGAIAGGAMLSWLHGILSIKYKINQIVSGTVINIFSTGLTSFLSQKFLQVYQNLNEPPMFTRIPIPGLADIPLLGPLFFNTNIFVYAMFIFLIVLQVALFRTKWGLRMRAVGEHPKAADTLGIDVFKTRWMAVLLSGCMAGFAGGFYTLGSVGRFDEEMTAGKGFIGLAAMIFGNWTPIGSLGAGFLFGFADSLASKLSLLGSSIPPQIMAMMPYIATMIVLAGVVGKGHTPAADGEPYEKE